jgi:hypothetical protein
MAAVGSLIGTPWFLTLLFEVEPTFDLTADCTTIRLHLADRLPVQYSTLRIQVLLTGIHVLSCASRACDHTVPADLFAR